VEDLAGLGVAPRIVVRGLVGGQNLEGLHGELRTERERLERGDQRIPPEQRREPRDAGRHVALARVRALVDQQAQIRNRALQHEVEQLVVADDRGRAAFPGVVRGRALVARHTRDGREQRGKLRAAGRLVTARLRCRPLGRPDRPAHLAGLARPQRQRPAQPDRSSRVGAIRGHVRHGLHDPRRFGQGDVGQHLHTVHAVVAEGDPPVTDRHGQQPAARPPWIAADLEDVGAVHPELEFQRDRHGFRAVVDDAHPLLEPVATDQALAPDADGPPHDLVERMDLRIRIAVR
jgi:hypothetical protein